MKPAIIFVAFFIALSLVCTVSALEVEVSKYELGAWTTTVLAQDNHPSDQATYQSAYAQSFRPMFNGANLTNVQLVLRKTGTPTGNLVCKIEGANGVWGSSNVPNGTVYATSANYDISTLTTSAAIVNFTFAAGYIFDASQVYELVIYNPAAGITSGSYLMVYTDASVPYYAGGNLAAYLNGAWGADVTQDMCYIIYGSDGTAVSYNYNSGTVIIQDVTQEITALGDTTVNVDSVTASAGTATVGTVNVEATVEGGSGDLTSNNSFLFLVLIILIELAVTAWNKVPILNIGMGIVGFAAIGLSLNVLPFPPYSQVMLMVLSIVCLLQGYLSLQKGRR